MSPLQVRTAYGIAYTAALLLSLLIHAADVVNIDQTRSTVANNPYHRLGWVPKNLVDADVIERQPLACSGIYTTNLPTKISGQGESNGVAMLGDSVVNTADTVTITGNVELLIDGVKVFADKIVVTDGVQFAITGNVRMHTARQNFVMEELLYNKQTHVATSNKAAAIQIDIHGYYTVSSIQQRGDGVVILGEGTFSLCEPHAQAWSMYGSRYTLDRNIGWGEIDNFILRLGTIPIFYLPYFRFPLDGRRLTGLLYPDIQSNQQNGYVFSQPIYLNLHPQMDDTLTVAAYSNNGLLLANEFRVLTAAHQASFGYAWIRDRQAAESVAKPDAQRSEMSVVYAGGRNRPWSTSIDYTQSSDRYFYEDLNRASPSGHQYLIQRADAGYITANTSISASVQKSQPLQQTAKSYERVPEITLHWGRSFAGMSLAWMSQYTAFDRGIDPTAAQLASGYDTKVKRTVQYGYVNLPLYSRPWLHMNAIIDGYQRQYNYTDRPALQQQAATTFIPRYSLTSTVTLDRKIAYKTNQYLVSIQPEITYLYVPAVDQNGIVRMDASEPIFRNAALFTRNRFQGIDVIGDTNQASFSVTSRVFSENGDELVVARAGFLEYFADRKTTLIANNSAQQRSLDYTRQRSPFAYELQLRLLDKTTINAEFIHDPRRNTLRYTSLRMQTWLDARSVVNAGFLQDTTSAVDAQTQTIDISGFVQVSSQWSVYGRSYYDVLAQRFDENLFGVEYAGCCWVFRVAGLKRQATSTVAAENVVMVSYEFKRLGRVEGKIGKYSVDLHEKLRTSIAGFDRRAVFE